MTVFTAKAAMKPCLILLSLKHREVRKKQRDSLKICFSQKGLFMLGRHGYVRMCEDNVDTLSQHASTLQRGSGPKNVRGRSQLTDLFVFFLFK